MKLIKKTLSSFAILAMLSTSAYSAGETLTEEQIASGAAGSVASTEGGFVVAGTFISTASAIAAGLLVVLIAAAASDGGSSSSAPSHSAQ